MKILITGAAGFIGFHTTKSLLKNKVTIVGLDSINNYYDTNLKKQRIRILKKLYKKRFIFKKVDICNKKLIFNIFKKHKFDKVVHFAAQAGVRYVKKNPDAYFESNLRGFYNLIEACRVYKIKHLLSSSTSSVYGANTNIPFSVNNPADHPTQFYAATKRSNEIIAHSYSHMFKIPITMIRFFTVYGPWGRPDMSLYIFVKNILQNKQIEVFNYGKHSRDFTYVDDIVKGIRLALNKTPKSDASWKSKSPKLSSSNAPFKILNLGNGNKISLIKYIRIIEKILKKKAKIKLMPFQSGDIKETLADLNETKKYLKFRPNTKIEYGVKKFIDWYLSYNN